jgi:hypothetical protein
MGKQRSTRLSVAMAKGEIPATRLPDPLWMRILRLCTIGLVRLLWWPIWIVLALTAWVISTITGAYWALFVLLCPSPKLQKYLYDHNQFWFGK